MFPNPCSTSKRAPRRIMPALTLFNILALAVGCSSVTDGGDFFGSNTIGETILALTLGPVGKFVTLPNTRIRNVADFKPFPQTPTDNPTTGEMRLRSTSVTVLPPPAGTGSKGFENHQTSMSGTARLRVVLDQPGATSPCDTGISVGTFLVTVQNGEVTDVSDDLTLNLGAVGFFLANNMSLCLEMEADFPATIEIDSIDVTFGPSNGSLRGTFELKNSGLGEIEIVGPGESPCTTTVLAAGGRRESVYTNLEPYQSMTFHAVGPDCRILDSVTCPEIDRNRYVGIVSWSGTRLECLQILPAPLPPPIDEPPPPDPPTDDPDATEACCLPDSDGPVGSLRCLDLEAELCEGIGGDPLGPETHCNEGACDASACCFTDPTDCVDLRMEDCDLLGGDPQSTGVYCESDPCPEEDEACCLPDGTCLDGPRTACLFAGGTPRGEGTSCADGYCVGACCDQSFLCTLRTEQQCNDTGGTFRGERSACTDSTCPFEACCLPFIQATRCFLKDPEICRVEGGILLGTRVCPAVCPVGACCTGADCAIQFGSSCTGRYLGDESGCVGVNKNECPDEGACCLSNNSCQSLSAVDCANAGGQHKGDNSRCTDAGICPTAPTIGTLMGIVTDAETGDELPGATLRVDRSPAVPISVRNNPDGTYSLPFPDLPDFFALTASHPTHIPQSVGINKASAIANPQPINFALQFMRTDTVVIEAIPDVHHLGNDSFSGSVNSQFQKSAEGTVYTNSFPLIADQLPPAFNSATLRMLQKGTECPNTISIDGTVLPSNLTGAPFDGSFGEFTTTLDMALLQAGSNTIVITSMPCFGTDPDDFEFVNAQILLNP